MSTAAFRRNFSKLLARAGDNAELVVRKTASDMLRSLDEKSPVDTGRFRSNWMLSVNSMDTSNSASPGRDPHAAASAVLPSYRAGGKIFITNSMPYAMKLEYGGYGEGPKTTGGYSSQSPQGMVRITVAEYGQHIARAVQGLRR